MAHETLTATGTSALAAGDWRGARDAFAAALDAEETPEALNGMGEALWWLGLTGESVRYRERAYAAFRRRREPAPAVGVALGLAVHYRANVGSAAASAGWLARARRLVAEAGLDELRGWVTLVEAGEAATPEAGEGMARDCLDQARSTGDLDLELCALAQIGACLVAQGRTGEGVALLDEAMAGALGGEGGNFDTVVFTSCNMIGSCTRCAEFERAVQWIRAADRFTERYGCPFLYLYCRTHYGAVLTATGEWAEADAQLSAALRESAGSQPPLHRLTSAALAGLRLAQGRLEEAAALVVGADGQGPAAPVAAALHLAHGRPALAAAVARRALDGADRLDHALLTELLGEALLAQGDGDEAARLGAALAGRGADLGCGLIRARGERLRGRALGERAHLDAALGEFARLGMPYEAARTRLLLAGALRTAEPEVAEAEARTALTALEGLGAGRDADAAAALLRELGVKAARSGPRGLDALTRRESEVLALLGAGLSNPEIAERLYLSRRTVEHHVASILRKLGVRNRAQAAAREAEASAAHATQEMGERTR